MGKQMPILRIIVIQVFFLALFASSLRADLYCTYHVINGKSSWQQLFKVDKEDYESFVDLQGIGLKVKFENNEWQVSLLRINGNESRRIMGKTLREGFRDSIDCINMYVGSTDFSFSCKIIEEKSQSIAEPELSLVPLTKERKKKSPKARPVRAYRRLSLILSNY